MALHDDNSEARTERPTNRRRQQARERGQVAHSYELLIAARLVAIWIVLVWWFAKFATAASTSLRAALEHAGSNRLDPSAALMQVRDSAWQFLTSATWPLITVTSVLVLSHFAQIGWLWRWENAAPQSSRLSPITGLERMLSLATLGRIFKLTLKLSIATLTIGIVFSSSLRDIPINASSDIFDQLATIGSSSGRLISHITLAMLTFAALDYAWQRWQLERSLQMTPDELREELKESEGNPELKSRRKAAVHSIPVTKSTTDSNVSAVLPK